MAIIQQHADGIIRDAPPSKEFNEYPKYMTHPAYQPGHVGPEVRSPGGFTYYVGGTSIRYPPMLVPDANQEEYYASQGYVSHGKSDPAAFAAAVAAGPPPSEDYQPKEYPKWVGDFLVNNREEEEIAAHKRRVQLGIDEPAPEPLAPEPVPEVEVPVAELPWTEIAPAEPVPEPSPEPPASVEPPAAPEQPDAPVAAVSDRVGRLEAAVDEIKAMFIQFMAVREPGRIADTTVVAPAPDVAPATEPSRNTVTPPVLAESAPTKPGKSVKTAKPRRAPKAVGIRQKRAEEQAAHAAKQVAAVMATH
jgi:hypothetical protein